MADPQPPPNNFTPTNFESPGQDASPLPGADEATTLDFTAAAISSARASSPGTIGSYRLIQEIGEGGMGQVWLAEQTAPLQRRVALKLIRAGMYDDSMLRRFQAERQSLAIMDHPCIAKVFDAGATADGQPYFVMEYVAGRQITNYCDERKLKIHDRLELFIQACEGVQHAHQKAIIHRDLKPANILVMEVDGKPTPRIIDFGLAKALGPANDAFVTRVGGFVGTPGFMSPEQADPSILDVDTRTDVYSLGMILYVLLTGTLPFDSERWRTKPFDEVLRELREEDAPSPSARLGAQRAAATATAENRGTHPRHLARLVHGDLDWITMKAIEKDRALRYGTPSDLAADIRRYLANEPVAARPASIKHRVQKYARRHWIGVSVASGLAFLLIGFAVVQAVQVRRITRERDRANRITDFMTGMFRVSDPSQTRGNTVTAREILDRGSAQIGTGLAKDPELQAQLMSVMGGVYQDLGLYPQSLVLLQQAIEIQRRILGKRNRETLKTADTLAQTLDRSGQLAEAVKLSRENVELSEQAFGPSDRQTLNAIGNLGVFLVDAGNYPEAEKTLRQALTVAESVLGPDHDDTRKYRANLALVLTQSGKFDQAEKVYRDELEIDRTTLGQDHPQTLDVMHNLAIVVADEGRLADAEKIDRRELEIQMRVHGPDHPDTLRAMDSLGSDVSDQGRYEEAEKIESKALEIERRVLGAEHPQTLMSMGNLVNTYAGEHRYTAAEKLEEETIAIDQRVHGRDNPNTAGDIYNLACLKAKEGETDEAITLLRQSLEQGLALRTVMGVAEDEDLKSLHGDPRFDAIVAEARATLASQTAK